MSIHYRLTAADKRDSQGCDPVSETNARYHGDYAWRVE